MINIHRQQLAIGDSILVAFSVCNNIKIEYATITFVDDYTIKIRFDSSIYFKGKTRTLNYVNSKCIKQERQ